MAQQQAQAKLNAAQSAFDEASKNCTKDEEAIAKGSYGFFESRGSTDATAVLDDLSTFTDGRTNTINTYIGQTGDATSLENMKLALERNKKLNDLRKELGLDQLLMYDTAMAKGQVQANFATKSVNHSSYFNGLENLAWGYGDPYNGWYNMEKDNYEKGSGETGHYLTIINTYSKYFGCAYANPTKCLYGHVDEIFLTSNEPANGEKAYTYDEYYAAFMAYYNKVMGILDPSYQAAVDAAQAEVDAANEALAEANAKVEELKKALETAKSAQGGAAANESAALGTKQDAEAKLAAAKGEAAKAAEAKQAADSALEQAEAANGAAVTKLANASASTKAAQDTVTDAGTAADSAATTLKTAMAELANTGSDKLKAATARYNSAVDADATAKSDLTKAAERLAAVRETLAAAQAEVDAAKKALATCSNDLDEKQAAYDKAAEACDAAQEKLDVAKAEYDRLVAAQKAADEAAKSEGAVQQAGDVTVIPGAAAVAEDAKGSDDAAEDAGDERVPQTGDASLSGEVFVIGGMAFVAAGVYLSDRSRRSAE